MEIAVVGSYGVGLTMFSPRMPEAGETISGGRFFSSHGGKGSNQAVGAATVVERVDAERFYQLVHGLLSRPTTPSRPFTS